MEPEFIRLQNRRFRISDISHYQCLGRTKYVGSPPCIIIYKKMIKEGYEVLYKKKDGTADKDAYNRDKDMLDELFLGKTAGEESILP